MRTLVALGAPLLSLLLACGGSRPASEAGTGAARPPAPERASAAPAPTPAPTPTPHATTPAPTPTPHATAPGPDPAWTPLLEGRSPELRGDRAEHVLRSDAEWTAWLQSVHASPGEAAAPDFSRQVVLAVDGEDGSNGCHAVRITGVHAAEGGGLRVEVTRYRPSPQQVCTMMMVRPFHAVAVTASPEGDGGRFRFEWSTATGAPAP